MTSFDAMTEQMNTQRKEWYGQLWEHVDWYGIANAGFSEPHRTDINKYLRSSK